MSFNNLPSETVLAIASFLPKADNSALARTSRRMCSVAEIQLYASVELQMGWSSYNLDKHPLNHFLASLMAKKERCIYVQSVSISFDRDLLYRDQVLLRALIEVLPCLRTFSFSCDRSIEFAGNIISSVPRRLRSHRARFESSLRASKGIVPSRPCTADEALTLSWSNQFDFNGAFFVSFVSLHSNIRCLNLLQIYHNNLPRMDASVLPHLESLQAPIMVVLALLPGRMIQRVKTHFFGIKDGWEDKKTDACGEAFNEDTPELENIKVFTCQRTWTTAVGFLSFLIRKMKNLEVLDLPVSSPPFSLFRGLKCLFRISVRLLVRDIVAQQHECPAIETTRVHSR